MSGENWESLITEKGFMRVPRALRLKRAELGITNNEYTILLDYVDYYSFSGTMNPYRHLTEVSGMNERSVRRILTSLENKGLLKRKVNLHGNGRTKGVVFSIAPLVKKLRAVMKKMSPTVGEEIVPYVGDTSVPPNTREEFNKREEDKNTSAKNADVDARGFDDVGVSENEDYGKNVVPPHPDPLPPFRGEGIKDESGEGLEYHGFIRGTGGPGQEAARNDRQELKTGQIHLARAGKGPLGLFSGEDDEQIYHPHPGPVTSEAALNRESITEGGFDVVASDSSLTRNRPARERGVVGCGGNDVDSAKKAKKRGEWSPSRWYNEVWRGLYEEAAGQPALTGGREYKSAETYFRRLRELNPEMEPGEVYGLAGEGAAFMIASQLEGGVFGWMHKPPDICMLASQAQSVEWHLRRMRRDISQSGPSTLRQSSGRAGSQLREDFAGQAGRTDCDSLTEVSGGGGEGMTDVQISFRERLREGRDANEQIERVYGELRGIERAARPRALRRGRG